MAKPSLPQGTRDFGPDVVRKRNYIFSTIKNVFELYGFQPLETPAMENIETLMGKYGDEGDKLIFKILNNGLDNPDKEKQIREDFEKVLQGKNVKGITERALKYDLTIPFARYVAMNHNQLTFPFKRYQIQPVWRADRPQKGRYREFYQCDADVVGSNSLMNEVELILIYNEVFSKLGIDATIKINSRKIWYGIAETISFHIAKKEGIEVDEIDSLLNTKFKKDEHQENINSLAISMSSLVDKFDKIGLEGVKKQFREKGFPEEGISKLDPILKMHGNNFTSLNYMRDILSQSTTGLQGLNDLEIIINSVFQINPQIKLQVHFQLARGLNYYTGTIFEIEAPAEVKIGSIGGGGRYDDLTGLFGVPNIPGVGISFGVDRIYDVMEELNLFPSDVHVGTQVLFFNLGENESKAAFTLMQQLRNKNIRCELYHESVKFDKQFKYAEKKNIPYAVIIGSKELEEQTCTIKNLLQSSQQTIPQQDLLNYNF